MMCCIFLFLIFFFKQKTAYEMRISDWSSDVCSSDLRSRHYVNVVVAGKHPAPQWLTMDDAVKHCTQGIGIWQWASNDQAVAPDLVMACCGEDRKSVV